jgi:glyoxylase-like metal-dependent hydrolase (beta-lactamase superfamily II)
MLRPTATLPTWPTRRQLLLAAAAMPWLPAARAQADARPSAPLQVLEVEAGIYMVQGLPGVLSPENGGRLGNAGFIVGRQGVMAIDSGTSFMHGQALLDAIAQVTPQPVRLVLLTQARQEFIFGAAAYQARGVAVHMQRRAAELMAARCETCLKALRAELGEEAMRGTVVPKPDVLFDDTHVLDTIGRPVLVSHHGLANGPGSASAFDTRTGTLFAGGLLDNRRIPDVQDGDLAQWRQAISALRTLNIQTIVPGHGKLGGRELAASNDRYLAQLEARCAALLKAGTALSAVPDAVELPEFSRWDQYDNIHRRNASVVFLRLERQQLLAPAEQGARS